MSDERDFTLRPSAQQKFRASHGEVILKQVLAEMLNGEIYDENKVVELSNKVAEEIRLQLKGLNLPKYKYIVQVSIAEQRGQAAHIMAECVWDADCDVMVHSFYSNNSLWCQAVAFAVFHY